jgi:Mycothiol maleylpyruvate isomerase N-terminal domain
MAIGPIDTAPLFGPLHAELITLLQSLTHDEWLRPTIAGTWRVRDVAAHLVDTALRRVAAQRDGHVLPLESPITSAADLTRMVNALNASGVQYARRLSSRQLVDLIDLVGGWLNTIVAELPPHGRAIWAVSWAGEAESENWMDVGREYTERWHHQMQIRDAVGRPLLLQPRWLDPLLDISVCVLPVTYAGTDCADGTAIRLDVEADEPRSWTLVREGDRWDVVRGADRDAQCVVRTSADAIWRLLFNALPPVQAREQLHITGDRALAEPLLRARSVIV